MAGKTKVKNPAAVALGRLGGSVKVPKGFAVLGEEASKAAGRKGAASRWAKAKKNPKKAVKGK
jgi:hypothetical protein